VSLSVGNARKAGLIGNVNRQRPVEEPFGVKGRVNLLALASPSIWTPADVALKSEPHKRLISRNVLPYLFLKIISHFRNHSRVATVVLACQGNVFHDEPFYGRISGPLPRCRAGSRSQTCSHTARRLWRRSILYKSRYGHAIRGSLKVHRHRRSWP